MSHSAPAGTVTFLFTDIEGSTRLWQSAPEAMAVALERHDMLARSAFQQWNGHVFATGGDGFAVAFARAADALAAACELQSALEAEDWPDGARIGVRMALHTGEAVERGGDYFGPAVNTVARLLPASHAGQVVVTEATRAVLGNDRKLTDLGAHWLRDLSTPVRVWQAGDRSFPPLRSIRDVVGNLPVAPNRLIGRELDVAEVIEGIGLSRVVTLTGVGGVGKTRLALAVASELAPGFADGCWLVDLSTREATDDLAATVARTVQAHGAAAQRALLIEHLRDRHALLVFDNCEHLIDNAAEIIENLLEHTANLRVLATSREPLGVDGEKVMRVRSLAVAGQGDGDPSSPAVELFLARAAEAGGRVDDDEATTAVVGQICRDLDGIPLAIELAAARTRGLAPAEILARLSERFQLLGGGRRSRERHRTLVATVKWSHDLLSPEEQVVWRRLSVFVGGFDLEAAEAVVGEPGTVDALLSLVDKSMLQADGTLATRYSMLETLRQFAADCLTEAGEVATVRDRHADHYLGLICSPRALLRGPDEVRNRVAIRPDRENVLTAAQHLVDYGGFTRLAAVLLASKTFWDIAAPAEGRDLCEVTASRLDDDATAANLLGSAAMHAWEAGDPSAADRLAREHLALAEQCGAEPDGCAMFALALVSGWALPSDRAATLDRLQAVLDRGCEPWLASILSSSAISVRLSLGDRRWVDDAARAERYQAASGSRSVAVAVAVSAAAAELSAVGSGPAAAAARLQAVADLIDESDSTVRPWYHWVAGQAQLDSDLMAAREEFRRAVRAADQFGAAAVRNLGLEALALTMALEGQLEDAARISGATRAYFESMGLASRSETGDRVWLRLDELLERELDPTTRADAEEAGRAMTNARLLALALTDAPSAPRHADHLG